VAAPKVRRHLSPRENPFEEEQEVRSKRERKGNKRTSGLNKHPDTANGAEFKGRAGESFFTVKRGWTRTRVQLVEGGRSASERREVFAAKTGLRRSLKRGLEKKGHRPAWFVGGKGLRKCQPVNRHRGESRK